MACAPYLAIRKHHQALVRNGLLNRGARALEICSWRKVDSEVGRRGVGKIPQQRAPIQNDEAGFVTIVVKDIHHAEGDPLFAQRERDGVAGLDVMLVGKGLADNRIVACCQFSQNVRTRPSSKERSGSGEVRCDPWLAPASVAGKPWY